ncbi:MAG: ABC transporter ATP-binding protein [Deltaproteobacteria bacterium]|nr:ABC transporter ATP-binding protein [Deltaproteobacteria bacterium]
MDPLLAVNNIEVIYHNVILVLKGMSLNVEEGQIVTILGNNGAGKTTTLKAISGLLKSEDGEVTDGQIQFQGKRIDKKYIVYDYFPRLKDRKNILAGYVSGGEQQMLVIGRGLMSTPELMLLDEPSMGLSPLLVSEIFRIIQRINKDEGVSILLVEQNARLALSIAEHGYVMENGRIVLDDTVDKLKENADVKEFYLGLTEVGKKKSYRDVKHYKRRKRWLT